MLGTTDGSRRSDRAARRFREATCVPVEPTLVILAIAVIANFVILLVSFVPSWLGRRGSLPTGLVSRNHRTRNEPPLGADRVMERLDRVVDENGRDRRPAERAEQRLPELRAEPPLGGRGGWRPGRDAEPGLPAAEPAIEGAGRTPSAYDRIVRVVALVFILGAITVVTASGVWADAQNLIILVLVVAALVVLVVHDLRQATPCDRPSSASKAPLGSGSRRYWCSSQGARRARSFWPSRCSSAEPRSW
jgi:hypothetical protein